jgi:aconitate hydratase
MDFEREPLGTGSDGNPVFLHDIWPSQTEINEAIRTAVQSDMFRQKYAQVFEGDDEWRALDVPQGNLYEWDESSTYVKKPPYFDGMTLDPPERSDIRGARVLAMLGDSITTDHISPAGAIGKNSPAGKYLQQNEVAPEDFNSYGSRRGNPEVMMRGTFANVRLRNQLAPGTEGGFTRHLPDGEESCIFEASERYQADGVPLIVLAGEAYGTGSSRDWAAKGAALLGIRAVIAKSYERIHRSNLIGMGVLPLQFEDGEDRLTLGLNGEETYEIDGIADALTPHKRLTVRATSADGATRTFTVVCRIDTPVEVAYYTHCGILQYVLRRMVGQH